MRLHVLAIAQDTRPEAREQLGAVLPTVNNAHRHNSEPAGNQHTYILVGGLKLGALNQQTVDNAVEHLRNLFGGQARSSLSAGNQHTCSQRCCP